MNRLARPGHDRLHGRVQRLDRGGLRILPYPDLPREKLYAAHFKVEDKLTGEPQTSRLYRKQHAAGKVVFGMTNPDGYTQVVPTSEPEDIKISFDANEKFHRHKADDDDINEWLNESGRMKKLLLAFGLLYSTAVLADDEMNWYKTELSCADARVTIRAFCEETHRENAAVQFNSLCSEQSLVIERAGHPTVKRNLLERQPRTGEPPLLLSSLRCVDAGEHIYLSGLMDNGGNCATCEREVLLGIDGRWKKDGRRWLASGKELRAIKAKQATWRESEQKFITNTTRDTRPGR